MASARHRIAILTDSTCDLPADLLDRYGIGVAPQHIILGTTEYLDRVEISSADFYAWLGSHSTHPKTSQPTVQDFLSLAEEAARAGAEEAVVIVISDKLSGSVGSAAQAAGEAAIPLHVVNSRSVSMGLGWQVLAAARARDAGASAQTIIDAANTVRRNLQVMFVVDTLEYLHRGGRIGGAARLVGTALQIKPTLYVDHETGRIEPGEKTRTMKRAVERMYKAVFSQLDTGKPLHVAVQHCNAPDQAEALASRIRDDFRPVELLVGDASIAIGTHGGPGTFGICAYHEP